MKMVILNYYVGTDVEVKEMLTKLGVCTYTRIPEVEGRISCSDPRENSHVWPGSNSTLLVVLEDSQVDALLEEVKALNASAREEGMDVYVLDVAKRVLAREE